MRAVGITYSSRKLGLVTSWQLSVKTTDNGCFGGIKNGYGIAISLNSKTSA
jgi:hypothetical protein